MEYICGLEDWHFLFFTPPKRMSGNDNSKHFDVLLQNKTENKKNPKRKNSLAHLGGRRWVGGYVPVKRRTYTFIERLPK